jgi:hypothetical protein
MLLPNGFKFVEIGSEVHTKALIHKSIAEDKSGAGIVSGEQNEG